MQCGHFGIIHINFHQLGYLLATYTFAGTAISYLCCTSVSFTAVPLVKLGTDKLCKVLFKLASSCIYIYTRTMNDK